MNIKLQFKKASRAAAKARIALIGPPGSGKTYSSLAMARGLVGPEGRIAVADSERGSAMLYAGEVTEFDHLDMPDHSPRTYIEIIRAAADAGYDALVIDSLSHAWVGKDGALEMVDEIARRSQSRNTFAAWRDVTPLHHQLVDAILQAPMHIICTMRSKVEWVVEDNGKGKQAPRKVGLSPVQRDGMEYEFDLVADVDVDHYMVVSKTRFLGVTYNGKPLDQASIQKPGEELGAAIGAWIAGGSSEVIASRADQSGFRSAPKVIDDEEWTDTVKKARAVWGKLDAPILDEVFQAMVTYGQERPAERTASLGAMRQMVAGVTAGKSIEEVVGVSAVSSMLARDGYCGPSPEIDPHWWLTALFVGAGRKLGPAKAAVSGLSKGVATAYAKEMLAMPADERASWAHSVLTAGWPHESDSSSASSAGDDDQAMAGF